MNKQTVFLTFNAAQGRHYITSWSDGESVSDSLPAPLWSQARDLIKIALAEGVALEARGDRFAKDGVELLVERRLD